MRKLLLRSRHQENGGILILTLFFIVGVVVVFIPTIVVLGNLIDQQARMNLAAQNAAYAAAGQLDKTVTDSLYIDPRGARERGQEVLSANLNDGPQAQVAPNGKYRADISVHNPWQSFRTSRKSNPTCSQSVDNALYGSLPGVDGLKDVVPGGAGLFKNAWHEKYSCWKNTLTDEYYRAPGVDIKLDGYIDFCNVPLVSVLMNGQRENNVQRCAQVVELHARGYSNYTFENAADIKAFLKLSPPGPVTNTSTQVTWGLFNVDPGTTMSTSCFLQKVSAKQTAPNSGVYTALAPAQALTGTQCTSGISGGVSDFQNLAPGRYQYYIQVVLPDQTIDSQKITWVVNPAFNDLDASLDVNYETQDTENPSDDVIDFEFTYSGSVQSVKCYIIADEPARPAYMPANNLAHLRSVPGDPGEVPCGPTTTGANGQVGHVKIGGPGSVAPLVPHVKYQLVVVVSNGNGAEISRRANVTTAPPEHRWAIRMNPPGVDDNNVSPNNTILRVRLYDNWWRNEVPSIIGDKICELAIDAAAAKEFTSNCLATATVINKGTAFPGNPAPGWVSGLPAGPVGVMWTMNLGTSAAGKYTYDFSLFERDEYGGEPLPTDPLQVQGRVVFYKIPSWRTGVRLGTSGKCIDIPTNGSLSTVLQNNADAPSSFQVVFCRTIAPDKDEPIANLQLIPSNTKCEVSWQRYSLNSEDNVIKQWDETDTFTCGTATQSGYLNTLSAPAGRPTVNGTNKRDAIAVTWTRVDNSIGNVGFVEGSNIYRAGFSSGIVRLRSCTEIFNYTDTRTVESSSASVQTATAKSHYHTVNGAATLVTTEQIRRTKTTTTTTRQRREIYKNCNNQLVNSAGTPIATAPAWTNSLGTANNPNPAVSTSCSAWNHSEPASAVTC